MSDRRRVVEGTNSSWLRCDVHGWDFVEDDVEDFCPVCFGEVVERTRIVALLRKASETHLVFGTDKRLVANICRLIEESAE